MKVVCKNVYPEKQEQHRRRKEKVDRIEKANILNDSRTQIGHKMTCVSSEDSSPHISVLRCLPRFIVPATGLHSAFVRESSLSSGGQSTGRDIITQSAVRVRTLFNSKWNIYFNTTITKWKTKKKRCKSLRMRRNLSEALSSELDMATTRLLHGYCNHELMEPRLSA